MKLHIYLDERRTTVTIHDTLALFLAIKLKTIPVTPEAHKAIRAWAQNCVDDANDPDMVYVSQYLQRHMITEIADKRLLNRYDDLLLNGDLDI